MRHFTWSSLVNVKRVGSLVNSFKGAPYRKCTMQYFVILISLSLQKRDTLEGCWKSGLLLATQGGGEIGETCSCATLCNILLLEQGGGSRE